MLIYASRWSRSKSDHLLSRRNKWSSKTAQAVLFSHFCLDKDKKNGEGRVENVTNLADENEMVDLKVMCVS